MTICFSRAHTSKVVKTCGLLDFYTIVKKTQKELNRAYKKHGKDQWDRQKQYRILIVILFLLPGCLPAVVKYPVSTEAEYAIKIFDKLSYDAKALFKIDKQLPLVYDRWTRQFDDYNLHGDCDDYMFWIGSKAIERGVDVKLFRYCIVEKAVGKSRIRHAVILFYGCLDAIYVTTTGVMSTASFIGVQEAYEKTGYYPFESWQKIDGVIHGWEHGVPVRLKDMEFGWRIRRIMNE